MRIKTLLASTLVVMSSVVAIFGMSNYLAISNAKHDALMINVAGRERMLSQKIAKELYFYYSVRLKEIATDSDITRLTRAVKLYDDSLNALLNGGIVLAPSGEQRRIEAVTNETAVAALTRGKEIWQPLYERISKVNGDKPLPELSALASDYADASSQLLREMNNATVALAQASESSLSFNAQMSIYTVLAIIIISYSIFEGIRRRVINPIISTNKKIAEIASGNLRTPLAIIPYNNEIQEIQVSVSEMAQKFADVVTRIGSTARRLKELSSQLTSDASETDQMITSNNDNIVNIVAATEEMGSAVKEIAGSVSQSSDQADSISDRVVHGGADVKSTVSSIDKLGDEYEFLETAIKKLKTDSDNISSFVTVIQEVAEQTNLLALNAAIEAARAGEQGRGFAVVADEVRGLAHKTYQSTSEIQTIVDNLQSSVDQALGAMESGVENLTTCKTNSDKASELFIAISDLTESSKQLNYSIATATEEQSTVVQDISQRLEQVNMLSEKCQVLANGFAEKGMDVDTYVKELVSEVEFFKTASHDKADDLHNH